VRRIALLTAFALALALATATVADAHLLSHARAKAAATAKARAIARRQGGEQRNARFTTPRCVRKNVHRLWCFTTVSGQAPCATAEGACDGPAPFSIPYRINVSFRSGRGPAVVASATVV
jgi:hypothetical protein